jgi:hypothetical protein
MALLAIVLVAAPLIAAYGDVAALRQRYDGRELLMMLELAAMLASAVTAILAAFFRSVPGRSRRWLVAPLPFLALWLLLSGIGCYAHLMRGGEAGWGDGTHCLLFILGASALVGPWLVWRLGRARPIEPVSVALLGGLGIAATSAFILQFFHVPAVTPIDLAMHVAAVLVVVGAVGLFHRAWFAPS